MPLRPGRLSTQKIMAEETNTTGDLRADEIEISDNWDEITPTFDGLGLSEDLLRGIYAYGFERPSAIQQVIALV